MTEEKIKLLIQEEVKSSMKKGDREKTTTLRMAISEIKKEDIEKKSDLQGKADMSLVSQLVKENLAK